MNKFEKEIKSNAQAKEFTNIISYNKSFQEGSKEKVSSYKRGFADGTIKEIKITKKLLEDQKIEYLNSLIKIANTNDIYRMGEIELAIVKLTRELKNE